MSLKIKVSGRALQVLHVEDNAGDAVLLKQVLKKAGFPIQLTNVPSGEEAISYLQKEGKYIGTAKPDVVLLDLGLPGKNGLTVLTEIRQNTEYREIPVLIFTNSDSFLDMSWAQRCNATQYLVKPDDLEQYDGLVGFLQTYWVKTFHYRLPA
jgi:CheY-like chemotaxis protein